MKMQGAIFDMDGTLLDSMPVWYDIGSELLRQKGLIPDKDLNDKLKPMSMLASADYLIREYHLNESIEDVIRSINKLLERHYRESIPLKPGVEAFLEKLKEQRIKMCVATATDLELSEAALQRLGVLDCFEDIITCNGLGLGKDNPEFFLKVLKRIGTPASETVVFEDALYAMKSAKAAGLFVAGVYDESALEDSAEIATVADIYLNSLDQWEMN